jgi:PAS domain-containing protein
MVLCEECAKDLSLKIAPSIEADKVASWLATLLENNLIPVVLYDPYTMQFVDANDEALQLCGYSRSDIVGLRLPDVVVSMDDMEPLLRRRFQPVMKAGPFEIRVPSGRFAINTLSALTTYKDRKCRMVALYPVDVDATIVNEMSASMA